MIPNNPQEENAQAIEEAKRAIFEQIENDSKTAKDQTTLDKLQEALKQSSQENLTWETNQASRFLDNEPPKVIGLCKKRGWTFPLNETSMLIAQGGTGKSFFLLGLMASLATGTKYLEFEPLRPYRVLGLFGEDSMGMIHSRIKNVITDLKLKDKRNLLDENLNIKSVINMSLVEYGEHQNPRLTENYVALYNALSQAKEEGKPIDVLVIDPLIRFYGLNENDNQQASFFIDTVMGVLQRDFGVSIILSHHIPKNKKENTINSRKELDSISPRGASAFLDNCRYAIAMMTFTPSDAKDFKIDEVIRREFVSIKPIKNNYTGSIGEPAYFRRDKNGVLLPTVPQKDLNAKIEEEICSCLEDYYSPESKEIVFTKYNSRKAQTERLSAELPPYKERPGLTARDITHNGKDSEAITIIQKRLAEAGLKNLQKDLGLRLVSLEDKGKIKIVEKGKRKEIILASD